MNPEPHHSIDMDDETLPAECLAALRALPSELASPPTQIDNAILVEARTTLASIRRRKSMPRLWPSLAIAASLALALVLFSQRQRSVADPQAKSSSDDPYALILREVTSLFPHQVRAIKTDGGELQIALSDEPIADGAQAVVIEACGNGGCTVIITYVGQVIEIERQQITVEASKDGVIILESSREPAPDLQIKSRTI